MGNFCDHAALENEAVMPMDGPREANPREEAAKNAALSCLLSGEGGAAPRARPRSGEGGAAEERTRGLIMPDCLLPAELESEDTDELDFSNDREINGLRPPAVFMGQEEGSAKAPMLSPARASVTQADIARLVNLQPPSAADASPFQKRAGAVAATPQKAQLQRSNSSYILATAAFKPLPRSDSSYILTKATRSQSAPLPHEAPSPQRARRRPGVAPVGPLVEDLIIDSFSSLDPSQPPLREKVLARLGAGDLARIEPMQGFNGGQNRGMWLAHDGPRALVLKLVEGARKHPAVPTEGEQCARTAGEHPGIRSDPALAFPIKVFKCRDASGTRRYDLIVMHKALGHSLAHIIAHKYQSGQVHQVMQLFETLGRFLAGIHGKYNMQHGDFQPSNIFLDEGTGHFTLIDVGGMDSRAGVLESDAEHFSESLRILANGMHAPALYSEGRARFRAGYAAAKRGGA